jgi:hypothetical protein
VTSVVASLASALDIPKLRKIGIRFSSAPASVSAFQISGVVLNSFKWYEFSGSCSSP